MCLAHPGKIIFIDKKNQQNAIVDFHGIKKRINLSLVEAKKGDFVVVHAGFAIQKLDRKDALDVLKLLDKNEEPKNKKSNSGNKRIIRKN